MSYKIQNFGSYRKRATFSKAENLLEVSDLLEVQKESYQWFITDGIKEVLDSMFPISSFSGNLSLDFKNYYFESPKHTILECKDRGVSYSSPLFVDAQLLNNETGEVKEQQVFLGEIPLMTETGTFIVNGAERVMVSQLVRSPSVYFTKEIDKNGRAIFACQIIPTKGTWLELEMDARDVLYVRIDRTRKTTITTLLRAFGLSSDSDIIKVFGKNDFILNTIAKDNAKNTDEALIEIYEKLKPGEPATLDSAKNQLQTRFFDEFRYILANVGRYKYNKKLNVSERLLNKTLAEDIKDKDKLVFEKGTLIDKEVLSKLKGLFEKGYGIKEVPINEDLDEYNKIQTIKVFSNLEKNKVVEVIGNDQSIKSNRLTVSDFYATVSYYLNLLDGIGNLDEIDHLGNRRVRQVGEIMQNQFKTGIVRMERIIKDKMSTVDLETASPKNLINIRPLTAIVKELFGTSQLSQFMDQVNPLSELTHKRRLSALGPGGLSRDRAGMDVRDVNPSHYGRICPIESPEGPNVGLITNLSTYAKINEYGFITTPYVKVVNGKLTQEVHYLTADEEHECYISENVVKLSETREILDKTVTARYKGETTVIKNTEVEYIDVSPLQIISISSACIPFLNHNESYRTLVGTNMQKQALPLLKTEAPIVGTGVEYIAAKDTSAVVKSRSEGIVEYVDSRKIIVKNEKDREVYPLSNYTRSNSGTCFHQTPIVRKGDKVKRGIILADGPSVDKGEIALGKNLLAAFTTFEGYNFEDAIIISERLVKDDVYTSLKIENYEIQCRETKLGPEEISRDIPNVGEVARKNLDARGIVKIGTEVKEGDILVGKVTPKGMIELTSEEKLLHAIFGEKTREVRDTSLRVGNGEGGIIHDIKIITKKENDELPSGVKMVVRVSIVQKRKISVGDKMAGRHGNKGVVSLILPVEDMPYLPDGTPIDILLSPLGVPSRMNIGQVLELHLGMAAKKLNLHTATPVFDGATIEDIKDLLKEAGLDEDGKCVLRDGRTGEPFDARISVGVKYMLKLHHMVDDKIHARAIGPYALVTQQPLGGKAQFGGQRFGEMEVWALYAYGAANILQELLTVKSDDVIGRVKVYESLVKGKEILPPGIPESFKVLVKEFQALGLDISMINDKDEEIHFKDLEKEVSKENILLSIEEIKDDEEVETKIVENEEGEF